MTTRRIVIAQHDFFRGGTERGAIRLAREWVKAGREVTILCGSLAGGLRPEVDARVRVVPLEPQVPRSLLSRFGLGRPMGAVLPGLNADIVFLPGNFHLPLVPALRRSDPRPVLVQQISNPPLPGGLAGAIVAPVFRYLARGVDAFAAMNGGQVQEIKALMPQTPVMLLRPPFEIAAPAQRQARSGGPLRVLWVGRLEPQKDVPLALATIRALNKLVPAHLTLLGTGALEDEVKRRAAGDPVTLLRHVPDLAAHYADADVLLITSHFEGGPAVAVEALAQGTPVVSTDCSPMLREVLTDAASGIIVPSRAPEDLAAAVASVYASPRPPLEQLRAHATPFLPEVSGRAYLDWFDSLVRHG